MVTKTAEEQDFKRVLSEAVSDVLTVRGMTDEFITKAQELIANAETTAERDERLAKLEESAQMVADEQKELKDKMAKSAWENGNHLRLMAPQGNKYDGMELVQAQCHRTYHDMMIKRMASTDTKGAIQRHEKEIQAIDEAEKYTSDNGFTVRSMESIFESIKNKRVAAGLGKDLPMAIAQMRDDMMVKSAWDSSVEFQGGSAFLPTLTSPILWSDVYLENRIPSLFRSENMASNTLRMRHWRQLMFQDWRRPIASPGNRVDPYIGTYTGVQTMESENLVTVHFVSQDEIEDSDIPMPSTMERALIDGGARAMEAVCVSGDTAESGNINNETTAVANAEEARRILDGLRKYALSDSTRQVNINGPITTAALNDVRALLGSAGVYASQHFYVIPQALWYKLLSLEQFARMDYTGTRAALITGTVNMLGEGMIYPVDDYAFPNPVNAAGSVDNTPGNNTASSFLVCNPMLVTIGLRTPPQLVTEQRANPPGVDITGRMRFGFIARDNLKTGNNAVAMGRNVTIS